MLLKRLLKKFFLKFIKFFLFLFFVVVFFIFLIFLFDFFTLKEIKVITINQEKKQNILGINEIKKQLIFFIDEKEIEKKILKKNPFIKEVKIIKKYPNILIIEIIEDKPIALLSTNGGYFYINNQGKIIYKTKNLNEEKLPLINFYQKFNFKDYYPGRKIDFKEINFSLFILEKMNEYKIKVNTLDIESVGVIVFYLEDKKIFFDVDKNFYSQWSIFEKIFREFKIKGIDYKEIDLRFDKPIVRF